MTMIGRTYLERGRPVVLVKPRSWRRPMPDQPYTTREGWFDGHNDGVAWIACPKAGEYEQDAPCLVVTGDLEKARRRLAPLDDAAIERVARAMFKWRYPASWTWTDEQRDSYTVAARVALAAAEGQA